MQGNEEAVNSLLYAANYAPLYSGHSRFTNQMIAVINEARIDFPSIGNIKKTFPASNCLPQIAKSCLRAMPSAMLRKSPMTHFKTPEEVGIYCRPKPDLVFFEPTNVCNSSSCAVSGIS